MLVVTASAVKVGVKGAAMAPVAMAAVVDETVAVVSAAKLPMARSGHPAKAVAVAKGASKDAKAKPGPHVVSVRNAVSAPLEKAVAMADLKPVVKTVVKTVAKLAPMRALKPVPMHRQSSTPMAPKCVKSARRVRVAVNEANVAVKVVVNAATEASAVKPMHLLQS
jgi:hypothetical protein